MSTRTPVKKLRSVSRCAKVMLVRERTALPATTIRGPRDVFDLLAPQLADAAQEHFMALTLDTQHRVKTVHEITVGTLDASLVHPREVFLRAVADAAAAIIVAHNHPSGEPTPTREDIDVTNQLRDAGKLLGIPVLDHIVIGDGRYSSMLETGLL